MQVIANLAAGRHGSLTATAAVTNSPVWDGNRKRHERILANILLFLPLSQLLDARNVSKAFRRLMKEHDIIRIVLFFKPLNDVYSNGSNSYPKDDLYLPLTNPFMRSMIKCDRRDRDEGEKSAKRIYHDKFIAKLPSLPGPTQDMLFTQPPICKFSPWCNCLPTPFSHDASYSVTNPSGITLREIRNHILEHFEECEQCPYSVGCIDTSATPIWHYLEEGRLDVGGTAEKMTGWRMIRHLRHREAGTQSKLTLGV